MDVIQGQAYEYMKDKPIEYFQKPNMQMMLKVISQEAQLAYDTIYKLRYDRVIDSAYGELLDVIGEIVGESREIKVNIYEGIFTFYGNPYGAGFDIGKFSDPSMRPMGSMVRDDVIYRLAIKARILINMGSGTPEEIIKISKLLTNSDVVVYSESNCEVDIATDTDANALLIAYAFESIQKALPAGVKINSIGKILYWDDGNYDEAYWSSQENPSKWDKAYWDQAGLD